MKLDLSTLIEANHHAAEICKNITDETQAQVLRLRKLKLPNPELEAKLEILIDCQEYLLKTLAILQDL